MDSAPEPDEELSASPATGKNELVAFDGWLWEFQPSPGWVLIPKSSTVIHHSEDCQHVRVAADYRRVPDPDRTLGRGLLEAQRTGKRAAQEFARSHGLVNDQGTPLYVCVRCVLRLVHKNARGMNFRPLKRRLSRALRAFDRASHARDVAEAGQQIERVQREFPLADWSEMPVERYALGHPDRPDNFCRLVEFQTPALGSISGGSAGKHIIYYRKNEQRWHHDAAFADVNEAWQDLRGGFVAAFAATAEGRVSDIDGIRALRSGPAMASKTLFCYFPDRLLPVYSRDHRRHFIELLSGEKATDLDVFTSHQHLKELVDTHHVLSEWHPIEVMRFLYWWADPRASITTLHVAPARPDRYWDDCLRGGYICVGGDTVGDLTAYASEEDLAAAFARSRPDAPMGGRAEEARKSASELWLLTQLQPGDRIVAHQGADRVLAVGTVTDDGYVWRADRPEFRHTVSVEWDTSYRQTLPRPEKRWTSAVVGTVSASLWRTIERNAAHPGATSRPDAAPAAAVPLPPPEPLFEKLTVELERKGQAVLYGPPGTGKTFTVLRFALWWLAQRVAPHLDPLADYGTGEFRDAITELSRPGEHGTGHLTQITFHPAYGYEDFIEGFRPVRGDGDGLRLELVDGVFKRVCRAAEANPGLPYLVVVDEINRGDLPRIFGELITLVERDKRGLPVVLPQSGEKFTVPSNVHLLGTMNTADRSIRLLDAALRRRFAFVELLPDPEVLADSHVGRVDLGDLLRRLNERVVAEFGRERQIGHSFFLPGGRVVDDEATLAAVIRAEVLPILQEYAYDDYTLLAGLLGQRIVDAANYRLHDLTDEELVAALYAELLVKSKR
ncbi:AAA domain-containing protein [Thermobifida alba]|uniref:AAA domain-containing protein n=1 Tax=Thermobifida alba TaxID=53522 RepID=A0ABY4L693_THEAE|nr:AAA family ATPase [Thermobifida alba]UPT23206.1 AAA domain-containing protein [Thermobifida alba]